jgi:hypothetical protein
MNNCEMLSGMNTIKESTVQSTVRSDGATRWNHAISYCSGAVTEDNKWSGARQKQGGNAVDGTLYYRREQITVPCLVYCRNSIMQNREKQSSIFLHCQQHFSLLKVSLYLQICDFLEYYAASSSNPSPTFRDNISVPSSRVKKSRSHFLTPWRWAGRFP